MYVIMDWQDEDNIELVTAEIDGKTIRFDTYPEAMEVLVDLADKTKNYYLQVVKLG